MVLVASLRESRALPSALPEPRKEALSVGTAGSWGEGAVPECAGCGAGIGSETSASGRI